MSEVKISQSIKYAGVSTHDIDLFEGQYIVPNGMAYNSYVIIDEKTAVIDTADKDVGEEWAKALEAALDGRKPDYLVVQHLEPDHSANIERLVKLYPDVQLVCTTKAKAMMPQFASIDEEKIIAVGEGDTLELGSHTLSFVLAPMVHWPEVMVTYESSEGVLFSADAFGKFGALDADEGWSCEARRYYFNIVGKYGKQVQTLLKKASTLDIKTICPLHGPVLTDTIPEVLRLYNIWSSYEAEDKGVFIACASIYGNTADAAQKMRELLEQKGCPRVAVADLARDDMAECVEDAFRHSVLLCMASSYDGGVFTPMADFLHHLGAKAFQNRKAAIVENGSWAPSAARTIKGELEKMKDITLVGDTVTIKTKMTADTLDALDSLAAVLVEEV